MQKTKKYLLNAVLQYLQPTEFYTPVSRPTTVQPTCTYGSTEFSGTANPGVLHSTDDISLPFFRLLTCLFCQRFFKNKNIDKIKKRQKT